MKYLLILACALILSACSSLQYSNNDEQPYEYVDAWAFTPSEQQFSAALDYISAQTNYAKPNWNSINDALYFMRAYSYYGDLEALTDEQLQSLNDALVSLAGKADTASTPQKQRFMEQFAVTVYRLLDTPKLHQNASQWLSTIAQQLTEQTSSSTLASDYALWESYRMIGFLAFSARSEERLANALVSDELLQQVLVAHIAHGDWHQAHALWALGYMHQLLDEQAQQALDQQVWQQITRYESDLAKQQSLFSGIYLVNSFRGLSSCEETFQGQCSVNDIDDALPINHACSESLFIRATSLDSSQLAYSCEKLTAQEEDFHRLLATHKQPVANDHNTALRVVIFDNYSDYNRYGQLLFDINTNNGGMYIEGTPSDPNNQATFYSFRAFWTQDRNKVWNLNHEYVHYLDGRFNKYGGFGHFPAQLVWWSEGLAELIAKGNNNHRANEAITETPKAERPTLEEIFATNYENSSSRQIYQWSYLAIRYLAEHDLQGLRLLQQHLKGDFYQGYSDTLAMLAQKHQGQFEAFLNHYPEAIKQQAAKEKRKVNKLYRYLYRDYLMPEHLSYGQGHKHIF
ncbi:collagenase [Pseudoalteromonas sp. YIC-656]|uniref:collagenase n=1 Tax=Pseudoalteromonas pernae TaxID=3118054 RepID=UPI003241BBC8